MGKIIRFDPLKNLDEDEIKKFVSKLDNKDIKLSTLIYIDNKDDLYYCFIGNFNSLPI